MKNKFNPKIKQFTENFGISRDYDTNPKLFFPVFLFTPDLKNTDEHFHIPLTKSQARKLRDWLNLYLKDRD